MFCHKCGQESPEGSAFCQKCGEKLIADETVSQVPFTPTSEPSPITGEAVPAITSGRFENIVLLGRVLSGISFLLLLLGGFFGLPINPVIIVVGVAFGIILSAFGLKRPLRVNKIIELGVAGFLLVGGIVYAVSSGGDGYIEMVKGGTLEAYPQMTLGEAFDNYLMEPEWETGIADDNDTRFVNVTGTALYLDEEAEFAVQFLVNEEEDTFVYYAFEVNEVPQNDLIAYELLDDVFGEADLLEEASPDPLTDSSLGNEAAPVNVVYDGTPEAAQLLVEEWLAENPIPWDGIEYFGAFTNGDGDKYYFKLHHPMDPPDDWYYPAIMVDVGTGELSASYDNYETLPMEEYYVQAVGSESGADVGRSGDPALENIGTEFPVPVVYDGTEPSARAIAEEWFGCHEFPFGRLEFNDRIVAGGEGRDYYFYKLHLTSQVNNLDSMGLYVDVETGEMFTQTAFRFMSMERYFQEMIEDGYVSPPSESFSTMHMLVDTGGDPLNVRSGPGMEYNVVGSLPNGAVVEYYGLVDTWGSVRYQGLTGWASIQYLYATGIQTPGGDTGNGTAAGNSTDAISADGQALSVGSTVYTRNLVHYVRGTITAISGSNSVTVEWTTALENNLWAFVECPIFSDQYYGYSFSSSSTGQTVALIGLSSTLPANELYSQMP